MMPQPGARPMPQGRSRGTQALSGTLLGFDFGERRIGVAVGETSTRLANPLVAIDAPANAARFERISRLVQEWRPVAFVVGLPPRLADGNEHPVARLAGRFARRLESRYRLPVFYVDETLTSATAEAELRTASRRRAGDVDALAAMLILQSFLDSLGPAAGPERTP